MSILCRGAWAYAASSKLAEAIERSRGSAEPWAQESHDPSALVVEGNSRSAPLRVANDASTTAFWAHGK